MAKPDTKVGTQKFGPEKRLHYRREYVRFFEGSESARLSECIIFRISNGLKNFRLGITLKARGSSVERNRVKRTIRESMRKQGDSLGSFDYNVVVPATKRMEEAYVQKLRKCIETELGRAKFLKREVRR